MYECISKFNKSLRMMYKLQHSLSKKKKKAPAHGYAPYHKDPFRKKTRT